MSSGQILHVTSITKPKYASSTWFVKSLDMQFSPIKGDNDAFLLMPFQTDHMINKMSNLMSIKRFLSWFTDTRLKQIGGDIAGLRPSDISRCTQVLKQITAMMKLHLASKEEEGNKESSGDSHFDVVSQNYARELKLMDLVFTIATIPSSFKLDTTYDSKFSAFTDKRYAKVADLISLSWRAMETMFLNNTRNEDYFARKDGWITTTISLVSDPIGAAVAFGKLIDNNADLLKRYVTRPIIREFKSLIKAKGLQSRLLSFFAAICTCKDKAIVSNQEAVLCELWLDEASRDQVLFKVTENNDLSKAAKLEIKISPVPDEFLGKESVMNGFKEILIDFSKIDRLSDFTVEGKKTCSVEQLCWVLEPEDLCKVCTGKEWMDVQTSFSPILDSQGNVLRMSDSNIAYNQLWDLAKYFKIQLELFAAMCYGRSYASIATLSKAIPYDMLVKMAASKNLPKVVRESSVKVLHRLYLDRYPHSPHCGRPSLPDLVWKTSELRRIELATTGEKTLICDPTLSSLINNALFCLRS